MKMEMWIEENVEVNGNIKNDMGVIVSKISTKPFFSLSHKSGDGCGNPECNCPQGCWLSIGFGRDEESQTVSGVIIWFDSHQEMYSVLAAPFFGGLNAN